TGRMGSLPPVDNIIASMTTVAAFYAFPLILPLSHRFGARTLKTFTIIVAAWSVLMCIVFSMPNITPFDKTHQKRFFGMHVENITSGEYTLQLGAADAAPGFEQLVGELATEFGAPGAKATLNVMDDWNPDWDVLYPFSQFVTSYKVAAPRPQGYESSWAKTFTVKAFDDILDFATGTRRLTLKISHPGLIWTVIAFDAWVVNWSLDSPPPHGVARHHIKEASFYDTNEWSIKLEIKVPGLGEGKFTNDPLKINFVGIEERAMWPGKKNDRAGPAMDVFERIDRWFEEKRGGTEDVMLLGCVAAHTRPLSPRQLGKLPANASLPQLIPTPTGNALPRLPNFIRPASAAPMARPPHPPPTTSQHVPIVPRSSSDSSVLPKNWNPYRPMSPDSKRPRPTKMADPVPSASTSASTSKPELAAKPLPTPRTSTASSTHQPRPPASTEDITMNLARMILTPPHTQRMVTYPGTSQYAAGGPSACGLTSLNAVRCVLQLEQTIRVGGGQIGTGPVGLSILGTMTKLEFVKDVMGIAPHWKSSEHLEVEDILGLPLFMRSLTCIGTEQRLTNRRNFKEVLGMLQTTRTNNSAAAGVLITRPPEIISILHFPASLPTPAPATFSSAQSAPSPPLSSVFAIFDSHTRPTHPTGSAFIVSASIDQTARYLEKLFAVDAEVLQDGGALLGAFDAHFVVPGDTPPTVSGPGVGLSIRPTDPDVYAANVGMLAAQMEMRAARQRAQREIEMVMEQLRRSEGAYLRERRLREARDARVRELEGRVHEFERARRQRREGRKEREREKSARASMGTSPVEKNEDPLQTSVKDEATKDEGPTEVKPEPEVKEDPLKVLTPDERGTLFDEPEVPEAEEAPVSLGKPMEDLDIATVAQIIEAAKPEPAPRLSTGGAIGFLASIASRSIPFWGSSQPDPALIPTPATPNPPPIPDVDLAAPEITFHCDICQDTEPEVDVAIVEGCGHRFGRDCLKGFVSSKLSDGKFPIVCPTCAAGDSAGTVGVVSSWLAESVGISQEEYERWTQLELAAYSFAIECTQCNRSYMVSREDYNDPGSKQFTCAMPDCDHTWCKSCSTTIEKGKTHTCDGSAELNRLMEREGWKKCPGCQAPIEKSEGCNHMTCTTPACNTHFCWVCGGKVIQSVIRAEINEAIMQHFSNLLSPVATAPDTNAQSTSSAQQQLPGTSLAAATSPVQVPTIQTTSSSVVQPPTSTSTPAPVATTDSTLSVLSTSSTESATSTTPLTSSAAPTSTSSTPVQTSAAAATTRAAATTPARSSSASMIRSSSAYTDSSEATETATPKSTGNAGTIVGAVAGGFVALIVLIAFVSWIVRQHSKRKTGNHDDFDRQSYLRNSMMIPDEPDRPVRGTQAALALARSNTSVGPRPPTMIERKNTYFTHGQPSPSFAPGQFISFEPGQIVSAPGTAAGEPAYPSPVAFAAYTPPDQHHQTELVRRPSGAQLLNRAPTNGGMYDNGSYAPSPVSFGPDSYSAQSPDSYGHDGYTYPMNPGAVDHRGMVQSVTPFQAQQYAEISRQLEDPGYGYEPDSFHPISPGPGPASPVVRSTSGSEVGSPTKGSPSPLDESPMPNPFDEKASQRIDSMPPALPPIESLSRTGTPIDPNPQHARWSYDAKSQNEGNRLSVAGMLMPEPPTPPPMAVIREDRPAPATVPAPASAPAAHNGTQPTQRPHSVFDADDAYGGM
ncbi:hypothetical protein FRC11_004415, partial [Ceratobasidium sp. 423]